MPGEGSFAVSPGGLGLQAKAIKCKAGRHYSETTCALMAGDQGICLSRHNPGFSKQYQMSFSSFLFQIAKNKQTNKIFKKVFTGSERRSV